MHRWVTFKALSQQERRLLLEAWLRIAVAALALRILSLPRVQALLRRLRWSTVRRASLSPQRTAELVSKASRHHLWQTSCLERSLVLRNLLFFQGIEADLRIGVQRSHDGLRAHAWIELSDHPLGEAPDVAQRFPPLSPSHPAKAY